MDATTGNMDDLGLALSTGIEKRIYPPNESRFLLQTQT